MRQDSREIATWLRTRVNAAGAEGLVVGLSGGIDSAVVARLCQIAMPEKTVAVLLPCHGDPLDESDARLVANHFRLPLVTIRLEAAYDRLIADLQDGLAQLSRAPARPPADDADFKSRVPLANVKPRLRMTALYFIANSLNYLVVGTGNRSELTIGYFTKHGDGGVDVLPIGNLLKSEVTSLARELDVPEHVIDKAPGAGLWLGQTDEAEMGFSYAELERYLEEGPDTVAPALALRVERLVRLSEHKRSMAPMPDDE